MKAFEFKVGGDPVWVAGYGDGYYRTNDY